MSKKHFTWSPWQQQHNSGGFDDGGEANLLGINGFAESRPSIGLASYPPAADGWTGLLLLIGPYGEDSAAFR